MMPYLGYSVGIPTLNRPVELRRCIEQVLRQEPLPRCILVADDGQLDLEELRSWIPREGPELIYHKKSSRGVVSSVNTLAEMCHTPWLLLLDDDILLEEGFVGRLAEVIGRVALEGEQRLEGLAGIGGIPYLEGRGESCGRGKLRRLMEWLFLINGGMEGRYLVSGFCSDYGAGWRPECTYEVEHLPGGLSMWRTEVLRAYRLDPFYVGYSYGADKDVAYRVSRKYRLLMVPQAKALHLRSPASRMRRRELGRMKVENQRYFYRNRFDKMPLSPLFHGWALAGQMLILALGALFSRSEGRNVRWQEFWGMLEALSGKAETRVSRSC